MIGYRRRLLGSLVLACLWAVAAHASDPARYAGRPVAEVLSELRGPGLDFIYSSELLPEDLRVAEEPRSREPLLVAHEILSPHGLALSVVRPGLYAVVAARAAAVENPPAGSAGGPPPQLRAELAAIVVSTSRYSFSPTGAAGPVRIGGELLAAQPVIGEDALRAVGRLPGIAQGGLSAQSSVRGGESGEVLTLLDGFPLRQTFHLPGYQGVFGVLDPGLIADADIYTGGFPARYGNRMAGVFDLRTVGATDAPRTALGLSVFNAMARHGGTIGDRADWLASARLGTLKPFTHAFAQDAGEPTYSDAYARVGFGDPNRLRLTASFLWSRDELSIERERGDERAQIESRSRYAWLRADRDWGESLHASVWLGHSRIHAARFGSMNDPDYAIASVSDRRSSAFRELRARVDWSPDPRHWFEGGFEWTDESGDYFYNGTASYSAPVAALFSRDPMLIRAAILGRSRERLAYFLTHRWQPGRDLVTEAGVRMQRTLTSGATTEDWIADPRVNLRWEATRATSLRAHWGRFHQTDEVHELKVEDGLTSFPDAQASEHFIVGIDHRFDDRLAARLEWFRKFQTDPRPHFENLLDPLSLVPEMAPDRVTISPTAADIRGAELSLVSEGPELSWWASLSWSRATDEIAGARVARSWDQTWAVTAGFDWTRGRWRYGAIAGVHRGWPTTIVGESALGERNTARFRTRIGLDLRAERRVALPVGSLALTFELANAVNVGNQCCWQLVAMDDGTGGTSFGTRRSDWLPLVPSIGALWEF